MKQTHCVMVAGPQEDPYQVVSGCVEALRRLGVDTRVSMKVEDTVRCAGLILPGGLPDVDPTRYGEALNGSLHVDAELDRVQMGLLAQVVQEGKPVLGICRGAQIINVFFGGSLIQNLSCRSEHQYIADRDLIHPVYSVPGSWMEQIYPGQKLVNTKHHQAVQRLAPGMLPAQIWFNERLSPRERERILISKPEVWQAPEDESFLIEAFQHISLPIFATQWHPELMALNPMPDTADPMQVFKFFISKLSTPAE